MRCKRPTKRGSRLCDLTRGRRAERCDHGCESGLERLVDASVFGFHDARAARERGILEYLALRRASCQTVANRLDGVVVVELAETNDESLFRPESVDALGRKVGKK